MSIRFFQQTITVLASATDTHGILGAIEVASPSGAAPPLDVHHREDEAFAGFETFFEEVADLATPSTDPRETMSQLASVAARYGVELLGPPRRPPVREHDRR